MEPAKCEYCSKEAGRRFICSFWSELNYSPQTLLGRVHCSFTDHGYVRSVFGLAEHSRADLTMWWTLLLPPFWASLWLCWSDCPEMTSRTVAHSWGCHAVYLSSDSTARVCSNRNLLLWGSAFDIFLVAYSGDCFRSVFATRSITLFIRYGRVLPCNARLYFSHHFAVRTQSSYPVALRKLPSGKFE